MAVEPSPPRTRRTLVPLALCLLFVVGGLPSAMSDPASDPVVVHFDAEDARDDFNRTTNGTFMPIESRAPAPSDSVFVFYQDGALVVETQAYLGLPFEVLFIDLPEAWLDYTLVLTNGGWSVEVPIVTPDVAIQNVPFFAKQYEATVVGAAGGTAMSSSLELTIAKNPCASMKNGQAWTNNRLSRVPGETSVTTECPRVPDVTTDQRGYGCYPFATAADFGGGTQWAHPATTVSPVAQDLSTSGAHEYSWTYYHFRNNDYESTHTSLQNTTTAGFGFYGANQFTLGGTYDTAFAGSWEGQSDLETQANPICGGSVEVGHLFLAHDAQLFYVDPAVVNPTGYPVVVHLDPQTKGLPKETCRNALPNLIEYALEQTNWGGYLLAVLPTKFCVQNWADIDYDFFGNPGRGIHVTAASDGEYAGATGYLTERYSTRSQFDMALEGNVIVSAYFRHCNTCSYYTTNYIYAYAPRVPAEVR